VISILINYTRVRTDNLVVEFENLRIYETIILRYFNKSFGQGSFGIQDRELNRVMILWFYNISKIVLDKPSRMLIEINILAKSDYRLGEDMLIFVTYYTHSEGSATK